MKETIRIGCGAGFSGDRLEPAVILAEKGKLDYLVLECLAERTIALAQKRKMLDPIKGYDPLLERRLVQLLPILHQKGIRLISNMGAANPIEGAKKIAEIAQKMNISVKIAAVVGDDVLTQLNKSEKSIETNKPIGESGEIISANAYLGVEGILEALQADAQIIITGRVADPSLFLAPMIHEFGWDTSDFDLLGKGTVIGHLMECAGQITGGYFADPIRKKVEGMATLGHPIAEISKDGTAVITKVEGTGGVISLSTLKERLLYEVINPFEYITPDVIADFTSVTLKELGENEVLVSGGGGKHKPNTLKVSVGYRAFYLGEGEISYIGPAAYERAKWAGEIIRDRIKDLFDDFRFDLIGENLINEPNTIHSGHIRLRAAAKASTLEMANVVGEEIEALYTNGPAGGGGVRKFSNEILGIVSVLMEREQVKPKVFILN